MRCARIYQFHPAKIPVVNYQGLMEVHTRWTRRQGDGPTYGECVRTAWLESRSLNGIICLEHDIAVSRECWRELADMLIRHPQDVAAVPYLLYPRSTGLDHPVWAHRGQGTDGRYFFAAAQDRLVDFPAAFCLGCTYLPGRLLNALPEDLTHWDYPVLDTKLSDLARELSIPCRCTTTPAIHLHY